jgi:GDP-D-mannose dehydratase
MSEDKLENIIMGAGGAIGIGVGIACGGAAGAYVLSLLPKAVTTADKVRNYVIASGTTVAVQKVVSDAVVGDVSETLAFIGKFAKEKKAKTDKETEETPELTEDKKN